MARRSDIMTVALKNLHTWGVCIEDADGDCLAKVEIAHFLGFKTVREMYDRYDEVDKTKFGLLAGPHAYAIYKAWKAKQC